MRQIPLTQDKVAKVDDEDFIGLSRFTWCLEKQRQGSKTFFYAKREDRNSRSTVLMHRQIMSAPKGLVVDHVDGDGLNNQRANLRLCTHSENRMNGFEIKSKKTSRYKGVYWDKSRRKWMTRIQAKYIGRFNSEEEAALAYDQAATTRFGEFAFLNFSERREVQI